MIKADFIPYTFNFNFPGGTSRGVLTEKQSFIIKIWDDSTPEKVGLGEVSLISGLSPENPHEAIKLLKEFRKNPENFYREKDLSEFPAVKFGIETALLDLNGGGKQVLFPSGFTKGNDGIQINGLIWMADKELMLSRIKDKVNKGFTCIKTKVGAINFNDELALLKYIREMFSEKTLEIRVDANGAFSVKNAMVKLTELAKYQIHSIEQPIKQGQWLEMAKLCKHSPIDIALDEELIGVTRKTDRVNLLETIKPQYIILKPSLIGGLAQTEEWADLATNKNIGWWVTSALESNIGLNAIAQWTYLKRSKMPQGLGTGQIFSNNIQSPLEIRGEKLYYNPNLQWKLGELGYSNSTPQPHQGGDGVGMHGGIRENPNVSSNKNTSIQPHSSTPTNVPLESLSRFLGRGGGWKRTPACKENNYHYNPKLKERARYLRNNGTKAEACLWKYALSKRPMGFQFTRQRPVLNYIADFMCPELMLIIEVDGATHFMDDLPNNDKKRQKDLEAAGFTVLRFEDEGVLNNMSGIQVLLEQYMTDFLKLKSSTPQPPQGGDGVRIYGGKMGKSTVSSKKNISNQPHSSTPTNVPLEGGGGWKNTSNYSNNSHKTDDKTNSELTDFPTQINSTPQPPQGGDGVGIYGSLKEKSTFSSNKNILIKSPESSTSQPFQWRESIEVYSGIALQNMEHTIKLNGTSYNLKTVDWITLKIANNNASWWTDIVDFLMQWSNDSEIIELKTSGSTGKPKSINVKKSHMWVSASKTCEYFKLNETSTGLLCLSASYIAGKMMLVRAMVSDMNLICIEPKGNPVKDLNIPIDFAAMVPMQVIESVLKPKKLNLIQNLIIGGGQVSPSLISRMDSFNGKAFETFGMTETLSHIALRQLTPIADVHFTVLKGVTIYQDIDNTMLIDFKELGIFNLKTNDIIDVVDTQGCFVWKGRTDFVINTGGIKVSPEEVENKIAHLINQRFCIKGLNDEKLGEKVVLFIESAAFDTNKLMHEIQKSLNPYQMPKEIRFIDQFPLTESGKIRRKEIF